MAPRAHLLPWNLVLVCNALALASRGKQSVSPVLSRVAGEALSIGRTAAGEARVVAGLADERVGDLVEADCAPALASRQQRVSRDPVRADGIARKAVNIGRARARRARHVALAAHLVHSNVEVGNLARARASCRRRRVGPESRQRVWAARALVCTAGNARLARKMAQRADHVRAVVVVPWSAIARVCCHGQPVCAARVARKAVRRQRAAARSA